MGQGRDRTILRRILLDPALRREMMVRTLVATQAREGIVTTEAQAVAAYEKTRKRNKNA
jgi:hypothetical protein